MFLCGLFTTRAQTADELFRSGDYQAAAVAFEFAYFEDQHDSSLLWKSYCYKALGDYDRALRSLGRVRKMDVTYEKALVQYLAGSFNQSKATILRYQSLGGSMDTGLATIMTLNEIGMGKYDVARSLLTEHSEAIGIAKEEVEDVIPADLKTKDPEKAYNLSLWLPGIGQWYAGHFWKGLLSGSIQAGVTGFTAISFLNGYYFSGTLTGAALFYTFYLGGARNAKNLAIERNSNLSREVSSRFLDHIGGENALAGQ